jgi:lambda family phage portal protein
VSPASAGFWGRIFGGSTPQPLDLAAARAALPQNTVNATAKRSVYAGAQGSRLTNDWAAPILSADQECRGDLRKLRARARELVRNNPIAKHFLNLLAINVVGPNGIRYQARVRNNDGQLNLAINRKIEAAWREWGRKGNCTVCGRYSFRAVQDLALRTTAMDGEILVRMVRGYPNKWGFALQLIDADQLDHGYSRAAGKGENEIRLGVEVDAWGKPVAYWITSGHPSDFGGSRERERVPADQIVHPFDPYRPNQVRGLTWFHPVMIALKMLQGYTEAELVAARVGAAKPGFFEYSDGTTFDAPDPDKPLRMEANPGVIEKLPPGLTYKSIPNDHPSGAFANFVQSNLRWAASGLGASYNSLGNDLVGVNYSSIRSGLLIERDRWCVVQNWFSEGFHQPIFDAFLPMALLSGALVLDSRDPSRFAEGLWLARGWRWVDPLKDSQGAILDIAAGLESPQRVAAERGDDIEEILEERAEFEKLCQKYGVTVSFNPGKPSAGKSNDEEDDSSATEDKEDDNRAAQMVPRTLALLNGSVQ